MASNSKNIRLIAVALVLALSGTVFSQAPSVGAESQDEANTNQAHTIANGQKVKIDGLVVKRTVDAFTLRGTDGKETEVTLNDKTKINAIGSGLFHSNRKSGPTDIMRGLRMTVQGKGNSNGQLVAENIRFEERDLRTAQALASRVDPVETQANSTQALAESNSTRIDDHEKRIGQTEQNAQRLSGQIEELSQVANAAGAAAEKAQTTADQARAQASEANDRIDSLDDYQVIT